MAEAAAKAAYESLEEFLDTLPKTPCEATPINRYYCTVCERLNRGVAERCNNSTLTPDLESTKNMGGAETPSQLHSAIGESKSILSSDTDTPTIEDKSEGKVEFKVVAPMKSDDDYPLIELVQPKNKKIEPIEMELLEDVAIEFEVSSDEPVEVEALEVEPLDDDYEEEDTSDDLNDTEINNANIVEVEVMEVDSISSEPSQGTQDIASGGVTEFKPIFESTQTPSLADTGTTGAQPKKKIKKKKKKKPIKKSATDVGSRPTIAQQPILGTPSSSQQVSPQVAAKPTMSHPQTKTSRTQAKGPDTPPRRPTRVSSKPPAKLHPLRDHGESTKDTITKPSKKTVMTKHKVPPRQSPTNRQPSINRSQPDGLMDTATIGNMGSAQNIPSSPKPTINKKSGRKTPKRKITKVKKISNK